MSKMKCIFLSFIHRTKEINIASANNRQAIFSLEESFKTLQNNLQNIESLLKEVISNQNSIKERVSYNLSHSKELPMFKHKTFASAKKMFLRYINPDTHLEPC